MSQSWTFEGWFDALPSVVIENLDKDDKICGICRVEYSFSSPDSGDQGNPPEKPIRLACGHVFGQVCLKQWLSPAPQGGNSNSCPTCRHQLFKARPSENNLLFEQFQWQFEEQPLEDLRRLELVDLQRLELLDLLEQTRRERQRTAEFMQRLERFEEELTMEQLWQVDRIQRIENLVNENRRRRRQEDEEEQRQVGDEQLEDARRPFEQAYQEAREHREHQDIHELHQRQRVINERQRVQQQSQNEWRQLRDERRRLQQEA